MIIFIIPYRERPAELAVFLSHMKYLLEDIKDKYFIYIVNQTDERPFNRGAMRNIGFLMAKKQFPETYKDIDLVFHDLDNLIGEKNLVDFKTDRGVVNHIFGSYKQYNIGGIFVMKGEDFERINGYPNFWGWGFEDMCLGRRIAANKIDLARKNFAFRDKHVVHLNFSPQQAVAKRLLNDMNKKLFRQGSLQNSIPDGIQQLKNLDVVCNKISSKIKRYDVNNFTSYIPHNTTRTRTQYIVSPGWHNWFRENMKKFVFGRA
jgi:hypothetical protein